MKTFAALLLFIGVAQCANLTTVRYLLWTSSNPLDDDYYDLLWSNDDSLAASPFDGSKRTHFAFHGWGGNVFQDFLIDAKTDILELEDVNYISVDWEKLGGSIIYEPSVANMYEVANYTAQFIDYLIAETSLSPSNLHIWGHSLGGQCAGMIGHYVESGVVGRVTALDPAGPSFYGEEPDRRVDSTSAAYVDIIHTHGGSIVDAGKLGMFQAIGHADFYPNGGSSQAGCGFEDTGLPDSGCSHGRSAYYFVESITSNDSFVSYPCESWKSFEAGECNDCGDTCDVMGYYSDTQKHGIYFLYTNSESPYAIES